jgi:hypothetical protein
MEDVRTTVTLPSFALRNFVHTNYLIYANLLETFPTKVAWNHLSQDKM